MELVLEEQHHIFIDKGLLLFYSLLLELSWN